MIELSDGYYEDEIEGVLLWWKRHGVVLEQEKIAEARHGNEFWVFHVDDENYVRWCRKYAQWERAGPFTSWVWTETVAKLYEDGYPMPFSDKRYIANDVSCFLTRIPISKVQIRGWCRSLRGLDKTI